jgi:uncharacterized DUF497 family protein
MLDDNAWLLCYVLPIPRIAWNADKNQLLLQTRGVSFEQVAQIIEQDGPRAILVHHNLQHYPNQRLYIVVIIRGYAYIVPVVETAEELFLKTIIPNRQMTRRYVQHEEQ